MVPERPLCGWGCVDFELGGAECAGRRRSRVGQDACVTRRPVGRDIHLRFLAWPTPRPHESIQMQ
jgi:hypothetical protein